MQSITIRKTTFSDIETIHMIEKESINSWTYDQFLQELNYEFSVFLAAECEGSITGYIVAWKVAGEIQINSIAVSRIYRKHGIGSMLLAAITEDDPCKTYSSIFIEVRSTNIDAMNFYIDNGFTKTGLRKNYYGEDDAVLMEKKL